jgi:hypothetical protein
MESDKYTKKNTTKKVNILYRNTTFLKKNRPYRNNQAGLKTY